MVAGGLAVFEPVQCELEPKLPLGANEQLDDIFVEPCARLMKWRKDRAQASQASVQRGMRELLRERSCLEDLRADLASAAQEKENVLRLKVDAERLGDHLRRSDEAAARRAQVVLRTKEALLKAREECHQRLLREQEALASGRRAAEARGAEVDGLLGLYAERLGLHIRRQAPQTVRMAFTLLDPVEPAREFSFALALGKPLEYQVFDCSPTIPDLEQRVARLNEEGHSKCALPAFLCGMRRAFQALAAGRRPSP